MTDVNAAIPLSFDFPQPPPGPDLGKAASGVNALLKFTQQAQQIKSQNALKTIFSDPSNLDASGMPTQQAMSKVMAIDPAAGLKLQQQTADLTVSKSDVYARKSSLLRDEGQGSYVAYQDALENGLPEPQARAVADKNYKAGRDKLASSGLFSQDEIDRLPLSFDPVRVLAGVTKIKDWQAQQEKDRDDKLKERTLNERERHDRDVEGIALGGGSKAWQVLSDPEHKDGSGNTVPATQYRYNPETAKSTTLSGEPYTPAGASKIGGGTQPRSAPAMAVQKYMQENPDASSEDISQFAANYAKEVSSTRAFGTGKQGDAVRSFNVGISHLNTLDGLVDALANKDMKTLNRMSNAFKEEFGSPAPTNFDAAKAIVGDEIIKAIVGGGGALADRENAQNQLDRAKTPEQLKGVIKTYKDLMGGQLTGLKKQYEDTTGKKDFDERLMPETKTELEARGRGGDKTDPSKMSDDQLKKALGLQ